MYRYRIILCSLLLAPLWLAFEKSIITRSDGKSPEKVLTDMFPQHTVTIHNIMLTPEEVSAIKNRTGCEPPGRLVSVYKVSNPQVVALAVVDIHTVRTQPEAVLYVFDPEVNILEVKILTFKEPEQYKPPAKWLSLLKGKNIDNHALTVRKDIPVISGATMSAHAITDHCRMASAIIYLYKQKYLNITSK